MIQKTAPSFPVTVESGKVGDAQEVRRDNCDGGECSCRRRQKLADEADENGLVFETALAQRNLKP
jgi:hypothetical protein